MALLGTNTETGTVTDHRDLLVKLNTFAVSLGWTTLRFDTVSTNHELILQSPNGAIVGYREIFNVTEDCYNLELQGFTNYNASLPFHEQAGALEYFGVNNVIARDKFASQLSLNNQAMTYWFNLAFDKILIVAKIGSIYVSSYSGFIKRAASPLQYPYPMFVGGNSFGGTGINTDVQIGMMRYSQANQYNSNPIFGVGDKTVIFSQQTSNSRCRNWVMMPSGQWEEISNSGDTSFLSNPVTGFIYGYGFNRELALNIKSNYENSYELRQALICSRKESGVTNPYLLGEFFSQYCVAGESLLPEDTITVGADSYILFPDVYRNAGFDYFAMKIE